MQRPSLLTRDDTFFGVCEGLGEDFGFHPNFLRLAFAGMLFWNPTAALAAYAAAGVVVALTRWLVPEPKADVLVPEVVTPAAIEAAEAEQATEQLPLAA